jgi:hypothetical protein
MSRTSRNHRRDIVIDGKTWRWFVGSDGLFVWEPLPSTRRHIIPRPRNCFEGDFSITPRFVAEWIRHEHLGQPRPERPALIHARGPVAPVRIVATDASQPEVYMVVPVHEDPDGSSWTYAGRPLEAHLDPQVAKDRVRALNADHPERLRLREVLTDIASSACYSPAGRQRTPEEVEVDVATAIEGFFRVNRIYGKVARDWIKNCPTHVVGYATHATPLYASAAT